MLQTNRLLAAEPYAMDMIVHIIENYDFLDTKLQKDLLILIAQCNQSITADF